MTIPLKGPSFPRVLKLLKSPPYASPMTNSIQGRQKEGVKLSGATHIPSLLAKRSFWRSNKGPGPKGNVDFYRLSEEHCIWADLYCITSMKLRHCAVNSPIFPTLPSTLLPSTLTCRIVKAKESSWEMRTLTFLQTRLRISKYFQGCGIFKRKYFAWV